MSSEMETRRKSSTQTTSLTPPPPSSGASSSLLTTDPSRLRRSSSPAAPGGSPSEAGHVSTRRSSASARGSSSREESSRSAHPTDVVSRNLPILPSRMGSSPALGTRSGEEVLRQVLQQRRRAMSSDLQDICLKVFSVNDTVDDLLDLCYDGDLEKIHYLLVDRMYRVMEEVRVHDGRILSRPHSSNMDDDDDGEVGSFSEAADSGRSPAPPQLVKPICIDEHIFENTLTEFLAVLWYTCLPLAEEANDVDADEEEVNTTTALLDDALAARKGTGISESVIQQMGGKDAPARRTLSRVPSIGNIKQKCRRIIQEARHARQRRGGMKAHGFYAKVKRLLPWRVRFLLGGEIVGSADRWSQVPYTNLELKSLWSTFGQPTHWFTLEYTDDAALEKGFQVDFAIRARKYPYWYCFLAVACIMLYVWLHFELNNNKDYSITFVRQFIGEPTVLLIFAALIKLVMEVVFFSTSLWFLENYFMLQLGFGAICGTAVIVWMYTAPLVLDYYTWKIHEPLTFAVIVAAIAGIFNLRFVHVIVLAIYFFICILSLRWIAVESPAINTVLFDSPAPDLLLFVGSVALIATVQYMYESLCRKDYVLSLTLATESDRSERLLSNVLPGSIIRQLKENQDDLLRQEEQLAQRDYDRGSAITSSQRLNYQMTVGFAEAYSSVSILFSDVVGFTTIGSHITPEELVQLLNELFTLFDDMAEDCGLEKIKTIGDAYMAAAGLPNPNPMHAQAAARMGLRMIEVLEDPGIVDDCGLVDHLGKPLRIRVGMHSGHCVAGVIGRKKFIYDVWGDCVNTASRMESHGEEMRVHCTAETARELRGSFDLTCRGLMEIKGKGMMVTYFVDREREHSRLRDYSSNTYYCSTVAPTITHSAESDDDDEDSERGLLAVPKVGRSSSSENAAIDQRPGRGRQQKNEKRRVTIAGI